MEKKDDIIVRIIQNGEIKDIPCFYDEKEGIYKEMIFYKFEGVNFED